MNRRPHLVIVALVGLVLAFLAGCAEEAATRSALVPAAESVPRPGLERVASILREWDAKRAAAYASGSVAELRRLYVGGSAAGAADARLLQRYRARGLVVTGMRTQVLEIQVLAETERVLRVRVTDRLVGAQARGPTGVLPLPRDSPTTRVVALSRSDGEWRVASVLVASVLGERGVHP